MESSISTSTTWFPGICAVDRRSHSRKPSSSSTVSSEMEQKTLVKYFLMPSRTISPRVRFGERRRRSELSYSEKVHLRPVPGSFPVMIAIFLQRFEDAKMPCFLGPTQSRQNSFTQKCLVFPVRSKIRRFLTGLESPCTSRTYVQKRSSPVKNTPLLRDQSGQKSAHRALKGEGFLTGLEGNAWFSRVAPVRSNGSNFDRTGKN